MARMNTRLEAARTAYREALEAARSSPTPEAWARLLTAGKELSAAQEPKPRSSRRGRHGSTPTYRELEEPAVETQELESLD